MDYVSTATQDSINLDTLQPARVEPLSRAGWESGVSMIETLLEVMMGKTGRYLLDLYYEYHLLINAIVITYGVSLVWAHMNLREMVHEMEKLILKVAASLGSTPNPDEIFTTFAKEWQEVPEKQRSLNSTRTDLWLTMIARKEMVKYLGIRPDYVRVVLSKAGLISEDGGLEKARNTASGKGTATSF